jgi:hypothetical protein
VFNELATPITPKEMLQFILNDRLNFAEHVFGVTMLVDESPVVIG